MNYFSLKKNSTNNLFILAKTKNLIFLFIKISDSIDKPLENLYRITELDADTNSEKFGAQRKCIAKRCSMLHTADYLMNNSTR